LFEIQLFSFFFKKKSIFCIFSLFRLLLSDTSFWLYYYKNPHFFQAEMTWFEVLLPFHHCALGPWTWPLMVTNVTITFFYFLTPPQFIIKWYSWARSLFLEAMLVIFKFLYGIWGIGCVPEDFWFFSFFSSFFLE